MREKTQCTLCQAEAERYRLDDNAKYGISCPNCGEYHLTQNSEMLIPLKVDRAMLASYVRTKAKTAETPPFLDELDIFKIFASALSTRGGRSR